MPRQPKLPAAVRTTLPEPTHRDGRKLVGIDGYSPALIEAAGDCCMHDAPWDDEYTILGRMCQTCAYDVIINNQVQQAQHYQWFDNGTSFYDLTCSLSAPGTVKCAEGSQVGESPGYVSSFCKIMLLHGLQPLTLLEPLIRSLIHRILSDL